MKNVTDDELKQVIGDESAKKLNEIFAGRNRYFPKNVKLMTDAERNELILEAARAGIHYKQIAEGFELSESRIYDIIRDGISQSK